MLPYLIAYTYVIGSRIIRKKIECSKNQLVNFVTHPNLVFFVLFLFAALRGNGDGDYFNYINGVKMVDSLDFVFKPTDYPFELGFRALSYIGNFLKLSPQFVIIAMNAISFSSIYYVLKKTQTDILLSLIYFFPIMLLYDMHHSRSAVAMSLGLVFFLKLIEYEPIQWYKPFIYLLLALSFHKSSIILLVIPFLVYFYYYRNNLDLYKKYDLKDSYDMLRDQRISFLLIFMILIFVLFFQPLNLLINLLDNPLTYNYYYKASSYLTNKRWSYPFKLYDPRLLLSIFIYFSFYHLYEPKLTSDGLCKQNIDLVLHKIYFFSIVLLMFFRESTIITLRIFHYFNIFIVLYYPLFLSVQENDTNRYRLIKFSINFIYVLYTIALIYKQVPYYFYF